MKNPISTDAFKNPLQNHTRNSKWGVRRKSVHLCLSWLSATVTGFIWLTVWVSVHEQLTQLLLSMRWGLTSQQEHVVKQSCSPHSQEAEGKGEGAGVPSVFFLGVFPHDLRPLDPPSYRSHTSQQHCTEDKGLSPGLWGTCLTVAVLICCFLASRTLQKSSN